MRISFCTTCANRLYQFKRTIKKNLAAVIEHPNTEWIVVNYNSKDQLDSFMLSKLPETPHRLIYVRVLSPHPWHVSAAKNVAHLLASGDILVNLDCDNFIGDAIRVIENNFSPKTQMLHLWSGTFGDGTYGRIAIAREAFYELGGYDESFYPMGYQDEDILNRASALGMKIARHPCRPKLAIKNSKEHSIKHCRKEGLSWNDFMSRNRQKSFFNIANARLIANKEGPRRRMRLEISTGFL
jgi:hypothetical protein